MLDEAHGLAMALRGSYLTMHRKADSFFVKHGVTADQYVLLHLLASESGVTQQTLVARASSDPNTVRAMLLLLEGRGLVTRKRHPVDGRARSVSITKKGLTLFKRLQKRVSADPGTACVGLPAGGGANPARIAPANSRRYDGQLLKDRSSLTRTSQTPLHVVRQRNKWPRHVQMSSCRLQSRG